MARLIDQDFAKLEIFLNQYTLSENLKFKVREQLIKRGHKHCLAALQIWATFEYLANNEGLEIKGIPIKPATSQLEQISESFSEITSSFFTALHGLYKPAHMSLRSSIETFTRGVAGLHSIEALSTTNVYQLFDLAGECDAFSGLAKPHFQKLHQQYVQLCGFTHSATNAHMAKNHAISNFPKQDTENFRVFIRNFEVTVNSILSILLFSNKSLYLKAPPQVQDIYQEVISKDARLFSLGAPSNII